MQIPVQVNIEIYSKGPEVGVGGITPTPRRVVLSQPQPYSLNASTDAPGTLTIGAQTVKGGWNGLSDINDSPPDPDIAAGNGYVTETVGSSIEVFDTGGNVVWSPMSLCSWFAVSCDDTIFDPNIIFDEGSGMWFTSAADDTNGKAPGVLVGVSRISNGIIVTFEYFFGTSTAYYVDFPAIGTDDGVLVITANEYLRFTQQWIGPEYWVLNKADMTEGQPAHYSDFGASQNGHGYLSVRPAQHLSSSSVFYMASTNMTGSSILKVFAVTGIPPSAVSVVPHTLNINQMNQQPDATQAEGTTLGTNDNRVLSAAWFSGNLWLSANDRCTRVGQLTSCGRFIEIATSSWTKPQDFDWGINNAYVFYPSLSIDSNGGVDVVAGYSCDTCYPSVLTTGRLPADPANTLEPAMALKIGNAPGMALSGRWGDFFGAMVDPAGSSVWVVGEYGNSDGYYNQGTWISNVALEASSSTYYLTMQKNGAGSVTPNSGYYPAGSVMFITAAGTCREGISRGTSFSGWTGSGRGSYTGWNNPATVTMNSGIVETATFTYGYCPQAPSP